ncbi:MAG: ATP-binding protein [Planctomycetota bacterium]
MNPSKSSSFFLFGPRGCGKTTLIKSFFKDIHHLWIDFLNLDNELRYRKNPELLAGEYLAMKKRPEWIVIDEVQKVPKILDVVHRLIEEEGIKFALTCSSARKLRRSQSDLLAGRAFNYSLFPFSYLELNEDFNLEDHLNFGSLPKLFNKEIQNISDKKKYLQSYVSTYLREEIIVGQLVRNIEPFHRFLELAAQVNGEIINYSRLAREAGIADKSVARYFEILSDTLMGYLLPAYHKSVRKQQIESPRFYFYDIGVVRALRNDLKYPVNPQTYDYGKLFESFVIMEILKQNIYFESDFKLYYLKTKEGREIDLIIEDSRKTFLIEIKSKEVNSIDDVDSLHKLAPAFSSAIPMVLCENTQTVQLTENIKAINWRDGIASIFNS